MENSNVILIRLMKQIFIHFLFLSSPFLLLGQTPDYNDWNNWEDICYCSFKNYHPASVVSADNNWQLLLAMKNGLTLKQLDSLNIPYTKSQLLLLETQRLLSETRGVYKTAVPILDSVLTIRLRKHSQFVASEIYPEIEKECGDLVAHLSEQNRLRNAYSILFSYVLDGLIWKRFEKEGIVKEWNESEIWSGNYWFLTPKRLVDCGGTNIWTSNEGEFVFILTSFIK